MNYFGLVILILLVVCVVFYTISLINLVIYRVPHVATFNSDLKIVREAFSYYKISGKKIVDLGSGTGKVMRLLYKEYNARITGYEIDASNYYISRVLNFFYKTDINVIKGNYLKADLGHFDCIYIYLYPCLIDKVEKKIFSESNKGTLVFVNAFSFNNHEPIKIFKKEGKDKIYVYKV